MSFNEESLDKLDEFRLKLVQLRPQKFKEQLLNVVLTKDDIEEIFNEHRNPTSANKMSKSFTCNDNCFALVYNQASYIFKLLLHVECTQAVEIRRRGHTKEESKTALGSGEACGYLENEGAEMKLLGDLKIKKVCSQIHFTLMTIIE